MEASSHPSHPERGTEGEATSRSRAGRSRRVGSRTMAAAGVAAPQHQCSASTVATLPLAATTEATLVPDHQLSTAEQWRHNIDQLIVTAIKMALHSGRQQPSATQSCMLTVACTPMAPQTPSVAHEPPTAHAPSVACVSAPSHVPAASIATGNIRAKLNRRCDGEDSHITTEL
jgi:hypothetical protein